jgi:hypothetical protein
MILGWTLQNCSDGSSLMNKMTASATNRKWVLNVTISSIYRFIDLNKTQQKWSLCSPSQRIAKMILSDLFDENTNNLCDEYSEIKCNCNVLCPSCGVCRQSLIYLLKPLHQWVYRNDLWIAPSKIVQIDPVFWTRWQPELKIEKFKDISSLTVC